MSLAALQQWGDEHDPPPGGPTVARRTTAGTPVRVGFVDDADRGLPVEEVVFARTEA